MTSLATNNSVFKLDDKSKAIYWWVQAFNYDYEKYVEALFPWDIDMQDKFLMNSKEYYEYLENRLINDKSWVSFVCDYFSLKIISCLSIFK